MASPPLMKAGRRRNQLPEPFQELAGDEQYWSALGPEGEITQHRAASTASLPQEANVAYRRFCVPATLFPLPSTQRPAPSERLHNNLLLCSAFLLQSNLKKTFRSPESIGPKFWKRIIVYPMTKSLTDMRSHESRPITATLDICSLLCLSFLPCIKGMKQCTADLSAIFFSSSQAILR